MRAIEAVAELRDSLGAYRARDARIAFVPTMGNLHEGHMALIRAAQKHADVTVVSLFVNPAQFGEGEDFDSYPRTLEGDMRKLSEARVELIFKPSVSELYPEGPDKCTRVEVPELGQMLCGQFRPQFFRGVCTIVNILFSIVQPDVALFGQKDYQQMTVIRRMVNDLHIPVEVIGVSTVREADGLAMSSRNVYLTEDERRYAPSLYRTLCELRDAIRAGRRDFPAIEAEGTRALEAEGFLPDYVAVRQATTLAPPTEADTQLAILGAAWLGRARLIDNVLFG